jgi:hypothetical protein
MSEIVRASSAGDRMVSLLRTAVRDPRISYRALGVLSVVLEQQADSRTSAEQLSASRPGHEGRDAVRRCLRELVDAGYLVRVRTQDELGHWSTTWHMSDDPAILDGLRAEQAVRDRERAESAVMSDPGDMPEWASGDEQLPATAVLPLTGITAGQPDDGFPAVGDPAVGKPGLKRKDKTQGQGQGQDQGQERRDKTPTPDTRVPHQVPGTGAQEEGSPSDQDQEQQSQTARTDNTSPERQSALSLALTDVVATGVPQVLAASVLASRGPIERACRYRAADGWTAQTLSKAVRDHDWSSARGAGAVVTWVRGLTDQDLCEIQRPIAPRVPVMCHTHLDTEIHAGHCDRCIAEAVRPTGSEIPDAVPEEIRAMLTRRRTRTPATPRHARGSNTDQLEAAR